MSYKLFFSDIKMPHKKKTNTDVLVFYVRYLTSRITYGALTHNAFHFGHKNLIPSYGYPTYKY